MLDELVRAPDEEPRREPSRRPAVERLLSALVPFFQRWASGRLPAYARRRADTGDIVQEVLVSALRRIGELDTTDPERLRHYLQVAIANRIKDEVRRARKVEVAAGEPSQRMGDHRPGPLDQAIESEEKARYRAALLSLDREDQALLVGRIELGLSYDELALATGRPSSEAARAAARRAAFRLARVMEPLARIPRTGTA